MLDCNQLKVDLGEMPRAIQSHWLQFATWLTRKQHEKTEEEEK